MTTEINVRRLLPEDAPALTALIRRCYGGKERGVMPGSQIDAHYCSQRRVLHLFDKHAGKDIAERVSALLEEYQPKITQIDLPLDNPDIDAVVESLNAIGFFFCALLPEFAHTDTLRLQAITSLAAEDLELNLINKDAIRLGNYICQSAQSLLT